MVRQWQAHTRAEFVTRDVDATMRTMSDNPAVLHVPTGMGGTGREGVRAFYRTWFVGRNAADLNIESVSRTVGDMTVVDELLLSFTHDIEVPWILPGVAATGRKVDTPVIAIVGFEGTAVAYEHVYWDQAAVLAQVGLLDRATVERLPVVTAPRALLDGSHPLNQLAQAD
ncbi:nuclear transport factor 2 family protein [Streptomyces sp. NEAU-YJ-81]|uniref:nuclear transport factor 2 family protein n=1 Tax=Streptomyces sp. NEAU-YJ-81 TaxID=2820288 RepID=UPI001ABC0022|nr:nuclear transport factor 2 family protein [Streptomyces sp. NEAU-YJ-81]MBO3676146.1 nuclear transport factor 2 family protein [Streptomyces sp. NEAU-YJ-81]